MLWYKINGIWRTWDEWHNSFGYTLESSAPVSYKKATSSQWGQAGGSGYVTVESQQTLFNSSYWADSCVGWFGLNELATECHLYPDSALPGPNLSRLGVVSPTVTLLDSSGDVFYLIREDLSLGWVTDYEAVEAGWQFGEPLCGVVTDTSDDIVLGEVPGNIDNGAITLPVRSLSSNTIPDSGVVEEYKSNVIEMLFGIYYDGAQWTSQHIMSYHGWASEILSLEDKQKLIDFGLTLTAYTGPYGTIFRGIGYTFEPIALYSDIDGTVQNEVDMSNFTCAILTNKGDSVGIQTASPSYDYWGWCMSWKCRITKNS